MTYGISNLLFGSAFYPDTANGLFVGRRTPHCDQWESKIKSPATAMRGKFYRKSRNEFGPSSPDFMLNKTEDVCTSD